MRLLGNDRMYSIQKVKSLDDELKKKKPDLSGEFLLSEKIEGWFVYLFYNSSTKQWSLPCSSSYREIKAFNWMYPIIAKLPKPYESSILIAEAYIPDVPFKTTNGLFNRTKGDCDCKDVIFMCHDLVPTSSFNNFRSATNRYRELKEFIDEIAIDGKYIFKLLPILYAGDYNEQIWSMHFDEVASKGGEGIVAKRANSFYSFGKRNSDLLKIKIECTIDTLAIELEEGFGEKGNDSLTLVSKRKNGTLIRTVIAKDIDKENFRRDSSLILGKVVEIKAMEEYLDGTLRHPVFKHIRHDKQATEID